MAAGCELMNRAEKNAGGGKATEGASQVLTMFLRRCGLVRSDGSSLGGEFRQESVE